MYIEIECEQQGKARDKKEEMRGVARSFGDLGEAWFLGSSSQHFVKFFIVS